MVRITRGLRALMVSAMAVLALGAIGASAAQGAEFHSEAEEANTTLTVTTDGTGKKAHQVIDLAGSSVTCAGISGHGLLIGAAATTVAIEMEYEGPCTFVGQPASVSMGSCEYSYTAHGTFSVVDSTGGSCKNNPIIISVPSPACNVTITRETAMGNVVNQNLESVSFHNIGSGNGSEITMEPTVSEIHYSATGPGCPQTGTHEDGTYTTGNAIVTGETVNGTTMVGISWG